MFRDKFSESLWFRVFLSPSWKLLFFLLGIGSNFYLSNYLLNPSIDKESIKWGNLFCVRSGTRAAKEKMMSKRGKKGRQ